MRNRWIFPVIAFAVFVLFIATIIAAWHWGGGWGDDHTQVARIVNADGTTGGTVLVDTGRDHHGFPFGILFIPLIFFGIFFVFRAFSWNRRGSGWGGPNGWNGPDGPGAPTRYQGGPGWRATNEASDTTPPAWFVEWERRQHEQASSTATPPETPSSEPK
jgi:phosphotransferase system  glucose/maltose/N-acetylglucosamine-specific IIC component